MQKIKILIRKQKKSNSGWIKKQNGIISRHSQAWLWNHQWWQYCEPFFEHPEKAAAITGIDENLTKRFGIILQTGFFRYAVEAAKFREYTVTTARMYLDRYPWYNIPSSVNKLLIHEPDIIQSAVLPIGMNSEEALEARNKDLRKYRELHTRKFSRLQTMTDLFYMLLVSSDPLISSISKINFILPARKTRVLHQDVKNLLTWPSLLEKSTELIEEESNSDTV